MNVVAVKYERYGVKIENPAQEYENTLSKSCMRQHEVDNNAVTSVVASLRKR